MAKGLIIGPLSEFTATLAYWLVIHGRTGLPNEGLWDVFENPRFRWLSQVGVWRRFVSPLRGSTTLGGVGGCGSVGWHPRLLLCQPYGLSEGECVRDLRSAGASVPSTAFPRCKTACLFERRRRERPETSDPHSGSLPALGRASGGKSYVGWLSALQGRRAFLSASDATDPELRTRTAVPYRRWGWLIAGGFERGRREDGKDTKDGRGGEVFWGCRFYFAPAGMRT